jgi:DNA polymerase
MMLVGEAPGATEEERREPFVGLAGRTLDEWLAAAGVDRAKLRIGNALACRPTQAGAKQGTIKNRPPRAAESRACAEHLREHVKIVAPAAVVAVGAVALGSLARDLSLAAAVKLGHGGASLPGGPPGQKLWAIYHPSGYLRMREIDPQRADEMCELAIAALGNAAGYVDFLRGVVAEVGQVAHG